MAMAAEFGRNYGGRAWKEAGPRLVGRGDEKRLAGRRK